MTPEREAEIRKIAARDGESWRSSKVSNLALRETVEAMTELLAELDALRAGVAWRSGLPDGPDFVLACVEGERGRRFVIRASYVRQYELVSDGESLYENCDYHEDNDEYYCPEGWYESNEFEEVNWHVEGAIIGWMPLPEPIGEQKAKL